MRLHTLSFSKSKSKQRRGRGGKRGTYSGRGIKGQKARAGRRIRPAERDVVSRMPKRRGVGNPTKGAELRVFNVDVLENTFGKEGGVVNIEALKKAGLLPRRYQGEVKILGDGEIKTPIVLQGLRVSELAREKLKKAGGKIEK